MLDLIHRIAARPEVYDWIQRAVGMKAVFRRLQGRFLDTPDRSVLEVGAGTGLCRQYLPDGCRYFWLDNDPQKLAGFRGKQYGDPMILGDATRIGLRDGAVDDVLCLLVAHHIPDGEVERFLHEISRVVRDRLIFLDPVLAPAIRSKVLWSLDRGAFPRRPEQLHSLISKDFEIEFAEEFRVVHRYFWCVARPRRTSSREAENRT